MIIDFNRPAKYPPYNPFTFELAMGYRCVNISFLVKETGITCYRIRKLVDGDEVATKGEIGIISKALGFPVSFFENWEFEHTFKIQSSYPHLIQEPINYRKYKICR